MAAMIAPPTTSSRRGGELHRHRVSASMPAELNPRRVARQVPLHGRLEPAEHHPGGLPLGRHLAAGHRRYVRPKQEDAGARPADVGQHVHAGLLAGDRQPGGQDVAALLAPLRAAPPLRAHRPPDVLHRHRAVLQRAVRQEAGADDLRPAADGLQRHAAGAEYHGMERRDDPSGTAQHERRHRPDLHGAWSAGHEPAGDPGGGGLGRASPRGWAGAIPRPGRRPHNLVHGDGLEILHGPVHDDAVQLQSRMLVA